MLDLTKDVDRFSLRLWLPATLCFAMGLVGSAWAQGQSFEDLLGSKFLPKDSSKAGFEASLTPSSAKPGDEVTLNVTAKLPPHSYIFATTGDFDARTQIETKNIVGLEPIENEFRPDRNPETKMDKVLNQKLSKFHGDVTWSKKFRVAENVPIEKVSIDLQLTGQYCSEGDGGQCTRIVPPVELHAAIVEEVPATNDEKPAAVFKYKTRPKKGKYSPVELQLQLGPAKSTAGKTIKVAIKMVLDEGWHTFSTTFKGEGGSATEIGFEKLNGLKAIGKGIVPNREPEIKIEETLKLRQEVYHNEITWYQEFEVLPGTKPNSYGVEGSITYQTCEKSCLPPRSIPFTLGVTSDEMTPPKDVEYVDDTTPTASVAPHKKSLPHDQGLLVFLLTAVGAAMVSLLTPCVFPMVPITVSFFLKQNENKNNRPWVLALVFCFAIVAAFVILGIGIAAIFGATQLNALANNSVLNLFLAGIFFAFALNMLGAFEIQVPSWLLNMSATGEQAGGYVGVIFMALTFVLTSFSCTFAFVGSLLFAAHQGEYYWPILGMLAFGTTFASPFFLLALAPGMLKTLPKSGGWLNSVKVVMGFVEMGVAIKYFSVVDQVLNSTPVLFDFTNVMSLWCVLSISTGLYLLGQFRLPHDSPVQGLSPGRVLLANGFLILGGLFAIGVTQPNRDTWLLNQLVAFAPARLDEDHELNFDKAVAYAAEHQKPLFIDFTGVNCVNCRLMEKRMAKPSIHRRLDQFVQAQLYTDKVPKVSDPQEAKKILDRNIALQLNWLGDVSLPSYAVVSPDGKTIYSTFMGLAQQESDFTRFLDEGYDKWRSQK